MSKIKMLTLCTVPSVQFCLQWAYLYRKQTTALWAVNGCFGYVTVPTEDKLQHFDEQLYTCCRTSELWLMNAALTLGYSNKGRYAQHDAEVFNFVLLRHANIPWFDNGGSDEEKIRKGPEVKACILCFLSTTYFWVNLAGILIMMH